MATKKKYTIDDFKDRLDSPVMGWDVEKKPAKKKTVKKSAKSAAKKGKSNAKK